MAKIWTELKDEDLQEVSGGTYLDSMGNELQTNDYVNVPYDYVKDYLFYISGGYVAWITQITGFSNGLAKLRIRYTQNLACNSGFLTETVNVPTNVLTKTTKPSWIG